MRKAVVLITGAGGEIGHALVRGLADSDASIITLDVNPLDAKAGAARPPRVHRFDHRRDLLDRDARGVRGRLRVSPRRAALDARRVHAGHRASCQRRRARSTCSSSRRSRANRTAGRSCFIYPSSIADLRAAGPRDEGARRARARGRRSASDDDVRVQQAVLRGAGPLLRAPLQAAVGGPVAARRLPLRAISGADLGDDDAVRRHVGLRARDDPCGGERASRTPASCGPTRRFRSWPCPMRRNALRRLAAAPRERLTRTAYNVGGVQPLGRRDPRGGAGGVSRARRSRIKSTRSDRGLSTRGRPTWTIRRRGPTGASRPNTTSNAHSANTSSRPSAITTAHDLCYCVCASDRLERRLRLRRPRLRARRAGRRSDRHACRRRACASTTSRATAGVCRARRRATRPAWRRWRCSRSSASARGVALTIRKGLPLSSGLGGSAASAAAAVVAVECAARRATRRARRSSRARSKASASAPDRRTPTTSRRRSAAASCWSAAPIRPISSRCRCPPGLTAVVVHPDLEIETAKARALLGDTVPLHDAVKQWANLGAFVHAPAHRRLRAASPLARGHDRRTAPRAARAGPGGDQARRRRSRRARLQPVGLGPVAVRAVPRRRDCGARGRGDDRRRADAHRRRAADLHLAHLAARARASCRHALRNDARRPRRSTSARRPGGQRLAADRDARGAGAGRRALRAGDDRAVARRRSSRGCPNARSPRSPIARCVRTRGRSSTRRPSKRSSSRR